MRNSKTTLTLLAGLTLACGVQAAEPSSNDDAVYASGMKVGVDPATGKIRQLSAAEIAELDRSARKAIPASRNQGPRNEAEARATNRKVPAGGFEMQLPQDRMSALVAVKQADGSLRIEHAQVNADGTFTTETHQEADSE